MEVTQADAYREACTALGEAAVAQRLLQQRVADLEARLAALQAQVDQNAAEAMSDACARAAVIEEIALLLEREAKSWDSSHPNYPAAGVLAEAVRLVRSRKYDLDDPHIESADA